MCSYKIRLAQHYCPACFISSFPPASFRALKTEALYIYRRCPSRGYQFPLSSHRFPGVRRRTPFPPVGGPHQVLPCKTMPVLARVVGGNPNILYYGVIPGLRSPMSYVNIDRILQPTNRSDPWVYQTVFHACRAHLQNLH